MQHLEVSGAVRLIYGSLGIKRLITNARIYAWNDSDGNKNNHMHKNHSPALTAVDTGQWSAMSSIF